MIIRVVVTVVVTVRGFRIAISFDRTIVKYFKLCFMLISYILVDSRVRVMQNIDDDDDDDEIDIEDNRICCSC